MDHMWCDNIKIYVLGGGNGSSDRMMKKESWTHIFKEIKHKNPYYERTRTFNTISKVCYFTP